MTDFNITAEISALLLVSKNNANVLKWMAYNLLSLSWTNEEHALRLCNGKTDNYLSLLCSCPYICVKKYDLTNNNEKELFTYLDKGYGVLLPVNTQLLGITSKAFYHNVFLFGYRNTEIQVFDFWPPQFRWEPRFWEYAIITEAVNRNLNHDSTAYVLNNRIDAADDFKLDLLLWDVWIKNYLNEAYDLSSDTVFGVKIYDCLCQYVMDLKEIYFLDHTIFHNLCEHFKIMDFMFSMMEETLALHTVNVQEAIRELTSKAMCVRNLSMKYWRQQAKINNDWRHILTDKILQIKQDEMSLLLLLKKLEGMN